MIELQDGLNFHNFYLDCQPRTFFKRIKGETIGDWLSRTAYQGDAGFLGDMHWRKVNKYWLDTSFEITFAVLSFLRENKIKKEDLEDTIGFELNLRGDHNWTISEIRKLELLFGKKLLILKKESSLTYSRGMNFWHDNWIVQYINVNLIICR